MEKVSFGILGCGFIGKVHMDQIMKFAEGAEIAGVFDPSEELVKEALEKYNIKKSFASAEDLCASEDIDAVIIASPNKCHAEQAILAANNGKHVIIEKPMSLNAADSKKIAEAVNKAKVISMVPHQMRWTPAAIKIRELVNNGGLGNIYYAKAKWFRQNGIPGWGSWFTRFEESGGGPLIDVGVHLLDLSLSFMSAKTKPESVFGLTYAEFGPEKKGLGTWGTPDMDGVFDVEDFATTLIKMQNGATVSLEVSWAGNLANEDANPELLLLGSEAGVKFEVNKGKELQVSILKDNEIVTTQTEEAPVDSRLEMLKHFVECVNNKQQTMAPAESGLINNLIIDAIYESSKNGELVKLDYS
ncbi:MAG: Gfo/Idh/MocA family protein [Planctomycetota bacterium]